MAWNAARHGIAGQGKARNMGRLSGSGGEQTRRQEVSEAKVYFGGVPTDADVEKLRQRYGAPAIGTRISYNDLQIVTGCAKMSNRFKTVVEAWRRKLEREHNLLLKAIPGIGYEVLDNHGRVNLAGTMHHHGLRKIMRAGMIAATTERAELSEPERRVCDHIAANGAAARLAIKTAPKCITIS